MMQYVNMLKIVISMRLIFQLISFKFFLQQNCIKNLLRARIIVYMETLYSKLLNRVDFFYSLARLLLCYQGFL